MPRCQKCSGELSFIPEYDRWFCYDCSSYGPRDLPPPEARDCPACGRPLDYIEEYERWYCHRCEAYAPAEAASEARMCPVCRGELDYIEEYERWYCDDCQEYAPREERFCPACDGPLAYLKEYERWYCYSCKSYPPKEEAAPVPVGEVPAEEEAAEEVPETAAPLEDEAPEEEIPTEEELPPIDVDALDGLLKADLIELAEAHGLASDGTKAVLKGRLIEHAEELAAGAAEEEAVPEEEIPPEEEVVPEEVEAPAAAPVKKKPAVAAPPEAARPKVEKVKPVRVKKVKLEAKCPTCAGGLEYIEDYGRHYCHSCGNYAPKDLTARLLAAPAVPKPLAAPAVPKKRVRADVSTCPTCGNPLSYIQAYDEWYCPTCGKYPEKEAAAAEAIENPCPTCGAELEHIPEYGRDYCYSCGNYAPKAEAAVAVAKKPAPAEEAVEAAPAMAAGPARPTLAFAAAIQFVIALALFVTSSVITLLVWGGVLGEFFLYQGGGFVVTAYGPLSGILITSGTPVPVNSFNILLFIAILFAGIGVIALVLSFLPKRK